MKIEGLFTSMLLICALGISAPAGGGESDDKDSAHLSAKFIDANGRNVGSARLTETANGVLIDAKLRNIAPGWHALHFHERGECKTPDFKTAGEHYNPHGDRHGVMDDKGPHAGDLPNFFVGDDGTARIQLVADALSLRDGDAALAGADGAALMIHAAKDDYRSQPSGDSGARIACAEIR